MIGERERQSEGGTEGGGERHREREREGEGEGGREILTAEENCFLFRPREREGTKGLGGERESMGGTNGWGGERKILTAEEIFFSSSAPRE